MVFLLLLRLSPFCPKRKKNRNDESALVVQRKEEGKFSGEKILSMLPNEVQGIFVIEGGMKRRLIPRGIFPQKRILKLWFFFKQLFPDRKRGGSESRGKNMNNVCLLTGLCQGPQLIHEIAGYKVLLQSLLPGSLYSLESTVQIWCIVATWNTRCWEMIVFAHALLLWHWLFSWLLFLTNCPKPPANHMLKRTHHRANFQKIPFASTFISQPPSMNNIKIKSNPNCLFEGTARKTHQVIYTFFTVPYCTEANLI